MSSVEPRERVLDRAPEIATNLALVFRQAIQGTKPSLNTGWLTNALLQLELSGCRNSSALRAPITSKPDRLSEKGGPRASLRSTVKIARPWLLARASRGKTH